MIARPDQRPNGNESGVSDPKAQRSPRVQEKVRALGLTSATGLVVGSIVGTGDFTMPVVPATNHAAITRIRRMTNLPPDGGHRAAVRFPDHRPPAPTALGIPMTIWNTAFATLYLTDGQSGHGFTEADEINSRAVASAAEVSIENIQLSDRAITTAKWIEAGRTMATAVLSGMNPHPRPLQLIAERACALTGAEQVIVLVPDDADLPAQQVDTLVVSTAVGRHANELIGQLIPVIDQAISAPDPGLHRCRSTPCDHRAIALPGQGHRCHGRGARCGPTGLQCP